MAGQLWSVSAEGGFMYSDELSDYMRITSQPLTKFRQIADAQDGVSKGLHAGERFSWNVYSNIGQQGRRLDERTPIPETGYTITQKAATVFEAGNSVPYTGRLEMLAKHDVKTIIDQTLRNDARKFFDIESFLQFNRTMLRATATTGTSTTSVTLSENGAAPTTNNIELRSGHIKAIVDMMKERNIVPYIGDDYLAISHASTYRPYKNDLETIKQYTEIGIGHIFRGEIGRYEAVRHIEQNFIPKGGAGNATTFDPWTQTAQPWANGKSSWAYFFGGDTLTEAICVPEEIRAKIPSDFGRSKAIAWYYLGCLALVHDDALNSRIVKWDSAT